MCNRIFKYYKVTHWFKILVVHFMWQNLVALLILLKFIFAVHMSPSKNVRFWALQEIWAQRNVMQNALEASMVVMTKSTTTRYDFNINI